MRDNQFGGNKIIEWRSIIHRDKAYNKKANNFVSFERQMSLSSRISLACRLCVRVFSLDDLGRLG